MTGKLSLKKNNLFVFLKVLVLIIMLTFICGAKNQSFASEINDSTEITKESEVNDENNEGQKDKGVDLNGKLGDISFDIRTDDENNGLSGTLQIILVLTVISLAPSILILVTSFTRIIIVLHFVRSALGMQTTPPNQVLIGLSLFLTFFIMSPVFSQIKTEAIDPLKNNEITTEVAFEKGVEPLREFMYKQIRNESDLTLFCDIAGIESVSSLADIPTYVLIPAFILSELRIAFYIGFIIYIPFIVIDMVVSSTLMSMGMMMLPPTVISTPFKILLFIVVDGWSLVVGQVIQTFY